VRRILIELDDAEWALLADDARRDRRTAQAQAGWLLSNLLTLRADPDAPGYAWARLAGRLAEAQGGAGGAGEALPPGEQLGAVEGHRDGPRGGVDQVVVGGPGEPEEFGLGHRPQGV
jgi:hypothetical protein